MAREDQATSECREGQCLITAVKCTGLAAIFDFHPMQNTDNVHLR